MIDREFHLPKARTEDRDRCRDAGIGDEVAFFAKPSLAQSMIERALAAEVPFAWVTGDEAYGQVGTLRMWLESRYVPHVLAVPKSQMVVSMQLQRRRVDSVATDVPDTARQRMRRGDRAHGPPFYD